MNIDNLAQMQQLDSQDILGHIDQLPEQFEKAWHHAQSLPLDDDLSRVRQIVICGMGGSAIGGDVLAAAIVDRFELPVFVNRGYTLPAWVLGDETLVIASSYSGNTEETLSAYEQATDVGARVVGITTGGMLAEQVQRHNQTAWIFPDEIGHPRAAIGWSVGMLMALCWRLGWLEGIDEVFAEAILRLKTLRMQRKAGVPTASNLAKQLANQLIDRTAMFVAAGSFEPIARRWKGQLNENANTLAIFDPLPEMNHNAVVGIEQPATTIQNLAAIFIAAPDYDHPRVSLRHQLTADLMADAGIFVHRFEPTGDTLLAQMLDAIQFGDYVSFYLAMAYGVDPAVIAPIISLKQSLKNQGV